jgi:hypothetical protein
MPRTKENNQPCWQINLIKNKKSRPAACLLQPAAAFSLLASSASCGLESLFN